MAGKIIKNYGTIVKGQPLKSGPQVAPKKAPVGKSPYPNGTSKKAK
jgi:hypothetical protein